VTVKRGLVFAGGFVAGVAWELGILRGLQDVNVDVLAKVIAADVIVGTSAGSTVAAQITSGTALDTLYAAQLSEASSEIEVDVNMSELMALFAKVAETSASATDFRRRIGALALSTETTQRFKKPLLTTERARYGHATGTGFKDTQGHDTRVPSSRRAGVRADGVRAVPACRAGRVRRETHALLRRLEREHGGQVRSARRAHRAAPLSVGTVLITSYGPKLPCPRSCASEESAISTVSMMGRPSSVHLQLR
jgi:hypothetical protein